MVPMILLCSWWWWWCGQLAMAEQRKLKMAFAGQATWVTSQEALSAQRSARCEHLLALLNEETAADAAREKALLDTRLGKRELRRMQGSLAKSRAEAADRVMRILQEYGVLSGDEAADYYT